MATPRQLLWHDLWHDSMRFVLTPTVPRVIPRSSANTDVGCSPQTPVREDRSVNPADRVTAFSARLHSLDDLLNRFATEHRIRVALASGDVHRVARGWYVSGALWNASHIEDRLLLRVLAAARTSRSPLVFSHASAAAIWGLPLFRRTLGPVQVTLPRTPHASSTRTVRRHVADLSDSAVTVLADLRCTTLRRTAIDLARTERAEVSLPAADAALRLEAPPPRVRAGSRAASRSWRDERARWLAELDTLPAANGHATARRLLTHVDARAESPLESVSRLHLLRMGFRVRLQVPVPAPDGRHYWVDLELCDHAVLAEVDGRSKYRDAGETRATSAEAVVYAEKRRHDWISGTTGKRLVRWGATDIRSTRALGERLRAFGVEIPRAPW